MAWTTNLRIAVVALALMGASHRMPALMFLTTDDPDHNTTAPTGALGESGWQWVGGWGAFIGTPIGPHHFLSANHIGGRVGDPLTFAGATYPTVRSFPDPASDLCIWEISGRFPTWAPIYRATDEVGHGLVVFGRGVRKGNEVRTATDPAVSGVPFHHLAGWLWGPEDGRVRWGENTVMATRRHPTYGEQLYASFVGAERQEVCHLGSGDSGGPVFINDGAGWKVAGVAGLVDSLFSFDGEGSGFNACLFDSRGLYYGEGGHWRLVHGQEAVPSGFYATRVSVRAEWVDSVLATPPTVPAQVTLGELGRIYDGTPRPAAVTTIPTGLRTATTYDGKPEIPVAAGRYAVVATTATEGYFGRTTGTLVIERAGQAINFAEPAPVIDTAGSVRLDATASSGLPVTFSSSDPAVASVSGSVLTIRSAGTTTLTAHQAGDSDHLPAPPVSRLLRVRRNPPEESGAAHAGYRPDVDADSPMPILIAGTGAVLLFLCGWIASQR